MTENGVLNQSFLSIVWVQQQWFRTEFSIGGWGVETAFVVVGLLVLQFSSQWCRSMHCSWKNNLGIITNI